MVDWSILDRAVLKTFGDAGEYLPITGGAVAMQIEIRKDAVREDEGGAFIRETLAFFQSGAVTVATGDRIRLGGETWAVDRLDLDDGFMTSVVLGRRE